MSNQDNLPVPAGNANGKRRRLLLILAAVFVAAAAGWGIWFAVYGRFHEKTDDAYVAGHVVAVTAQTAGSVVAVLADDTDHVAAGATLVRLDPADARVALEQAEAELARVLREVRGLYTGDAAAAATIRQREAEVARAREDLNRRQAIAASGAITGEELQHARDALKSAEATLTAARESRDTQNVLIAGTRAEDHPRVAAAAARAKESYLAWARTRVPAPIAGQVARRAVQLGQRVTPGMPLLAIVPLDNVWVDANFKESQLERIRLGQPVRLGADLYGGQVTYHGRVAGLAAGTGAAFALLPAQNATGNWIKVVQRVPVRIALDAKELAAHPLRVGLSMQVDVDTHEAAGTPVAAAGTGQDSTSRTEVFANLAEAADARVRAVVSAHLRGGPVPPLPPLEPSVAANPAAMPATAAFAKKPA
jgi:membrane fusion protein, multidrug efflux system